MGNSLSVLVVDGEAPSVDALTFLLQCSPLVGQITAAHTADQALHLLQVSRLDAMGAGYDLVTVDLLDPLDIAGPGLDGLELARIIVGFPDPPALAFVTAHAEHALAAFDVGAIGYLLKPVHERRLHRLLARVPNAAQDMTATGAETEAADADGHVVANRQVVTAGQVVASGRVVTAGRVDDDLARTVAVASGASTLLVDRQDIVWAEAAGDYVRVHTAGGPRLGYLLRTPLAQLEEEWGEDGFVRVHRSYLVALRAVREIATENGHATVHLVDRTLPVSRRHARELRDRLTHRTPRCRR